MHRTTQFCTDHWKALREAVDGAGLGTLVADSAPEAMAKIHAQETDGLSVDNFEPLAAAMMAITFNLFRSLGPDVIGDGCPLCQANTWHQVKGNCPKADCAGPDAFDGWIGRAVQDQVDDWKGLQG